MSWQRWLCIREAKLRVAMFLKRRNGLGALSGRGVWQGRPEPEVTLFERISAPVTVRLSCTVLETGAAWARLHKNIDSTVCE